MILNNPTGKGVRNDTCGAGTFGASRGNRTHNGVDYLCEPGQEILSPITGILRRHSRPYADDPYYDGVLIDGIQGSVKLWYFRPFDEVIRQQVRSGQPIGIAQDIGKKYTDEARGRVCLPHVHLRLTIKGIVDGVMTDVSVDPELFMEVQDYGVL